MGVGNSNYDSDSLIQVLKSELSIERPVDFRTFVEDPRYLGQEGVYPYWLDTFTKAGPDLSRVFLRGSTGAGKTTALNLYFLYKIYHLRLKGPDFAKTLGLMSGSPIYCLYFSVSITQAKISGFQQLKNMIDASPWFREHMPRDKNVELSIKFPNNFTINYASGEQHQISLNIWGFILDEANFRNGVGEGSAEQFVGVYQLAAQLENRLAQRFLRKGKENFFAGYISSASYDTAFIQERGDQYLNAPNCLVLDPVLYKVDPDRYTSERFTLFFGMGDYPPTVVESEELEISIRKALTSLSVPAEEHYKFFEKVPLELKDRFIHNIYRAIQDICGRPTGLRGSFITNASLVRGAYVDSLVSPFSQDFVTASTEVDIPIEKLITFDASRLEHPEFPHSLFMDISLQGDYGSITAVRYDGIVNGAKQHTHVFTLEFIPPQFPAATDLTKVQNFIIWLSTKINIVAFGSDQFASSQIRQEVSKELGISDIRVSLDSTDVPHLVWLSACASRRFRMLRYDRVDKEIFEAIHDLKRRRVVKRKGSSDDGFQTLVGAFYLSDTVGSSDEVQAPRINVVGASSANRLKAAAGIATSTRDPKLIQSLARQENRMRTRNAQRLSYMLDSLNELED